MFAVHPIRIIRFNGDADDAKNPARIANFLPPALCGPDTPNPLRSWSEVPPKLEIY